MGYINSYLQLENKAMYKSVCALVPTLTETKEKLMLEINFTVALVQLRFLWELLLCGFDVNTRSKLNHREAVFKGALIYYYLRLFRLYTNRIVEYAERESDWSTVEISEKLNWNVGVISLLFWRTGVYLYWSILDANILRFNKIEYSIELNK